MKAKHAERAHRLMRALDGLQRLSCALKDKERNFVGDDYRAFEISVANDVSADGCGCEAFVYLPLEFGEQVLPIVERSLRAELAAIGVEVDPE